MNRMSKAKAEKIATAMVKAKVSGYAGPRSLAQFNDNQLFTESAAEKILLAFWYKVVSSGRYPVIEKMYAQERLREVARNG